MDNINNNLKITIIAGYYALSNDGIGRYTTELVHHLKNRDRTLKINTIGFTEKRGNSTKKSFTISPKLLHSYLQPIRVELGYYERFKRNVNLLENLLRNVNADIYHAVSPSECVAAIRLNKRPLVTTIHDIIPLISESRYLLEKHYFKYYCEFALKSDFIIVDSVSTQKDLCDKFDIDKNKVKVIYPGFESAKFHYKEQSLIKNHKNILYLGGLVKRKGIYTVVLAFNNLLKIRRDIRLLVGGQGSEYNKLKDLIESLDITEYVTLLGFVDENRLSKIYNSADLFVYPSQYEGFGLTPLEAMACGIPVITSNKSSLPEVVGDAAITVDPDNIKELSQKMESVLNDTNLQKYLSEKGVEQAKKFTWEQCAEQTLSIYKTLG